MPPTTFAKDAPFFIVQNTASGRSDTQEVQDAIRSVLDGAGRRYTLFPVDDPSQLEATARRALDLARAEGGAVIAAGGDGTLNAVAQVVHGQDVPFGILPQGTFNYFGRTYGISQETLVSTRCLLNARIQPAQVGLVNDRVFLVNASLGLYPKLLEDREAYKKRYGRSRLVAFWSGIVTLFKAHKQLTLRIETDGDTRTIRTPSIVVGNNPLQLEHVGIEERGALEQGQLVAMGSKPVGTLALYGMLLLGLMRRLGDADKVFSFGFERLTVRPTGRPRRIKIAMDGEITHMETPITFRVSDHPLPLLVPAEGEGVERA